ncbi:MAG: helicase-related protein, partial [Deltaproteobacteria bacterium]|nr:helicase-related protein [Deltaproteobacteria bacterium]
NLLAHLIKEYRWQQVLVFTRTKHGANKLAEYLVVNNIPSLAIHGNKSQSARTRALAEFKTGRLQVLVATDIAARGLDIDQLPYVVNYELPNISEDYVHRIGRTGRAGRAGQAVSLVCVDELKLLKDIERLLTAKIPEQMIAGYEPNPHIVAEPIKNGRPNQAGAKGKNQHNRNRTSLSKGSKFAGAKVRTGRNGNAATAKTRRIAMSG